MALYVTDTHPLIWYATNHHAKLSRKVLRIFSDATHEEALVYVPAAVLWEISVLLKRGRVPLWEPFEHWARALLAQGGFDLAPLDLQVIAEASYLTFNGDPFDAVIVATARLKELPLITKDQEITTAGMVEIAW